MERLTERLKGIGTPDEAAAQRAQERWDNIAKPLRSLGRLEQAVVRIAGITGSENVVLDKRCVVPMCADNGVVAQGVTQTGSEVTAVVTKNFARGDSSVCCMARSVHADVIPVDIGVQTDIEEPGVWNRKVMYGTNDMTQSPAMSREQAEDAILVGMDVVRQLAQDGYQVIATGEMGIGNTTTSAAVASVLLGVPPKTVTGTGAGLSNEGLRRKIAAIEKAIALHRPDPSDPIDVLSKVGGLDIAGMIGTYLGGALYRVPVLIDGVISAVAALLACRICPACHAFMLPTHVSKEPAGQMLLDALQFQPLLTCEMCLGEGTGAVAALALLDVALAVYHGMCTFEETDIEKYEVLK